MNISFKELEAKFKDEAVAKWREICKVAKVGSIPSSHAGGIDLSNLGASEKAQIENIVGKAKPKAEAKAPASAQTEETNKGDN